MRISVNESLANINTNLNKKVNTSDVVNNLTSTSTTKPLSAAQGKAVNDKVTKLNTQGSYGGALKFENTSDNIVYGCYSAGIYPITGSEEGLPLTGYPGYMLTLRLSSYHIVKVLFLINAYCYIMSQATDGTVSKTWTRFALA